MAVRQDKVQIRIEFLTDEAKTLAKTTLDIQRMNKEVDVAGKENAKLREEIEALGKTAVRTAEQETRLLALQTQYADNQKKIAQNIKEIAQAGGDVSKIDLSKVTSQQLREIKKILVAQKELTTIGSEEYEDLAKSIDKVNEQLTEVDRRTKGVSSASTKMKVEAGQSFSGIGDLVGGVATKFAPLLAAVGAAIGVIRGLGAAVGKAADLEQTTIAFETFLGSAEKAKKLIDELRQFSNVTPLEPEQVITAGRQLAAFGFETENIIPILGKLGDVASGTGKDFNELVLIYGKAKASGKIQGDDLNQLAEAGIPIYDELGKVLGVSADQIRKLSEDGKIGFTDLEKVFANLTSEGGRFSGLMERQSQSLTGLFSTLKGAFDELLTNLGQAFLPIAKVLISILIPAMEGLKNSLGPILQIVGEKLVVAFNFLKQALQPVFSAFNNLKNSFSGLTADFSYFNAAAKLVGATLTLIGQYLGNVINNVASVIVYFRKFDESTGFLTNTFNLLKEAVIAPIKAITYLVAGLNGLVEFSKEAYTRVSDGVQLIVFSTQFAIAKIKGFLNEDAASAADGYYNEMQSKSAKLGTGLGDAFTKGWNNALGQFSQQQDVATKQIEGRAALQTRTLEQSKKDAEKAEKDKEKLSREQLKNQLELVEIYYSRQEALIESQRLRGLISESDFQQTLLETAKSRYQEQLEIYKKFGKDKELEAIKIGNKLIEAEAKLAPRQKFAPLPTLSQRENAPVKEGDKFTETALAITDTAYQSEMTALSKKLADNFHLEEQAQVQKLELKKRFLDKELEILRTSTEVNTEEVKKKETERTEIESELSQRRIDLAKREEELKSQAFSQTASALSDFFGAASELLGKDEESRKKNAEQIKFMKRAQVVLSSVNEVASIWEHAAANPINAIAPGAGYAIGAIQTAATIARTAFALDQIDNLKFARGGYTGSGYGSTDSTGFRPVGIVHENEWVAPKWQVEHPVYGSMIRQLDKDRLRGFATGGFTTPTFSSVPKISQTFTQSDVDMSKVVGAISNLAAQVGGFEGRLRVVYGDIKGVRVDYENTIASANF